MSASYYGIRSAITLLASLYLFAIHSVSARPERSEAKSKAAVSQAVLFDFAADAATLRANGTRPATSWTCIETLGFGLGLWLLITIPFLTASAWCDEPPNDHKEFRVCADPNNLPFSNRKQEGFENKIAELLAHDFGSQVTYTWWPQRRGFIRNTLNAGVCDVVLGVPSGYDPTLTTQPYYRSTYVFVYPKNAGYQIASFDDPLLQQLKIGVHLIGDDYANSPPAHALSEKGIVKNVVGYSVFGDYAEDSPPGKIIAAVAAGEVDMAIVWGPIAGYFAQKQTVPLTLVPVPADASSPSLPFTYSIALGVRRKDTELKSKLDEALSRKAAEVRKILEEYGVPLVQD